MSYARRLATAIGLSAILVGAGCPGLKKAVLGCRGTDECTVEGRCAVRTEKAGDSAARCYASSEADCAASRGCTEGGRCALDLDVVGPSMSGEHAVCRALTFAACAKSEGCKKEGACTPDGGSCVVTPAGCVGSLACRNEGRCSARPDITWLGKSSYSRGPVRCVRDEAPSPSRCEAACKEEGACAWDGSACVAETEQHCRESRACSRSGRCSLDVARKVCAARSETDCAGSEDCRSAGRCSIPAGADVCASVEPVCASACAYTGECAYRAGACFAADDEGCRKSVGCTVRGACSFDALAKGCRPRTSSECTESLECKAYGRCELREQRYLGLVSRSCLAPGEKSAHVVHCAREPCESEGRCLMPPDVQAGRCQTPEEAGLPPWRPPRFRPVPERDASDAGVAVPVGGTRPKPTPRLPTDDPPDGPLSVLVDGRPVPIQGAIASTAGEEAVRIVLSTHPLTCNAAGRGWQSLNKGESRIVLTLASLVAEPDGAGGVVASPPGKLRVSRASWSHGLEVRAGGVATLGQHAAERGATGRLRIAYDATFGPLVGGGKTSLELRGSTSVSGCGALPPEGEARPQPDVDVEVAGHRVPIRGAILTNDDRGPVLRLTSGPAVCPRRGHFDAPWDYEITFRHVSSPQLSVMGPKLDAQHLVVNPRILFEVVPTTRPDEVDVRVDDRGAEHFLPTRVRGIVHARRCADGDGR